MDDGKIICAVDFGTTYSGVAYAYVEKDQDLRDVSVELIEDHWPGMGSQSSPKVPSFAEPDLVFKFDKTAPGGFKWGFQLDQDSDRICYAKLCRPDPGYIFNETGETSSESQNFVRDMPMETILTVPAVWSDKAKSDTLQCAHRACFGPLDKIRMITEPEAAAVYTFHQLPDLSVRKGDIFITCDAGGGTVDLITYRVCETSPLLRVDEVTVGSGGLCGSVYLNRKFEALVQRRLGKKLNKLSRSESLDAMDEMQQAFDDDIKINFGLDDISGAEYKVPVPDTIEDDPDLGIESGNLILTGDELKEVFDPVIGMVIALINGQLDRAEESLGDVKVSALLLVGGFGSSEYLRQEIENHFNGEDDIPELKVIQPVNAWSAVTRGAMLRGIQGDIVETRIIRHHYGIDIREHWNPDIHEAPDKRRTAELKKIWDATEQKYFCSNVMRWYVKKGDKFTSKKVVTFDFYRALTNLSNLVFSTNLFIYTGSGEPSFFVTPDCRRVATLKSDLSGIPASEFELVDSGNGNWYKVSYDIEMSFEATLSFRLVFKGTVISYPP
ncbi:hypothetical protein N7467_000379 [Penicillium canescens]|nr:hypothetical protein N7467_000379 [Penicillium canescens]